MKMLKNNILRLFLLFTLVLVEVNIQAYAENQPVPTVDTHTEAAQTGILKPKLKAPIVDEISEEEQIKAQEEQKIKDELNEAQKTMGETPPPKVEDKDFDPNANDKLTQNVVPNTGTELMKLISMFAKVLLGVVISTIIIYFLLIFTKKFFHPPLPEKGEEDFDIRDLNSPKNTDEALRSFLDRTDD